MSLHPSLYARKTRGYVEPPRPPAEFLVTWANGELVGEFYTEASALFYVNWMLRVVRGVTDAKVTGPEAEYLSCECGCGRVFRDGTGNRLPRNQVYAPGCPQYTEALNAVESLVRRI